MLTQEQLRSAVRYCPETGQFWWVIRRGTRALDEEIGCLVTNGSLRYRQIRLYDKLYMAHQLAWLYEHGRFPPKGTEIDHIDGDGTNNAIANLRIVTSSVNKQNMSKRSDNVSGVTGVNWHASGKKWTAGIVYYGKSIYLGLFSDFADAVYVRKAAEQMLGFHPNHGREKVRY